MSSLTVSHPSALQGTGQCLSSRRHSTNMESSPWHALNCNAILSTDFLRGIISLMTYKFAWSLLMLFCIEAMKTNPCETTGETSFTWLEDRISESLICSSPECQPWLPLVVIDHVRASHIFFFHFWTGILEWRHTEANMHVKKFSAPLVVMEI